MSIASIGSNGEEPGDALSPVIIVSLARALKLYDPPHHGLQPKVSPILAALEQVTACPGWHVFNHFQNHICRNNFERVQEKDKAKDESFLSSSLHFSEELD